MAERKPRSLDVRSRIILLTVSLAALALAVAGLVLWVSRTDQVDREIDATLTRTAEEVSGYAREALDPRTGARYPNTELLLYDAMGAEVPATNEAIVAFVDGELRFRQQTLTLNVVSDREFVEHVAPLTAEDRIFLSTHSTDRTEYRFGVVPIQVGDSPPGALVLVYDRTAEHEDVRSLMQTFLWVSAAALSVAALAGWLLAGRMLRPIRELREVSATITERDLSQRLPVRGTDDLSELARSFNAMVDRLERAFASQRQLLDDAGHELRTPITVVRGHLELMDPNDPVDSAETRTLALGELDRMHRLADDLVMLAKAEIPDFVQLRMTDVTDLTTETFEHAQRLGDRQWEVTEVAEGTLPLDEQRLVQAWLQLAANAVKFSEDGSRIEMGSAFGGNELNLWVRDWGTGIEAEHLPRVFERFSQADLSRGGSGLGLAIVAAIAHNHGGRVDVSSIPGSGSTFVIRIPVPADAPQPHHDD
ncbi:MAG TPA: HAMP domain-containing sensor histidine kinase [Actinomycetaceae bacterium]|nr:HAMP domain-containing sensor histidine kinase [Actinomycetaceae bacterium]